MLRLAVIAEPFAVIRDDDDAPTDPASALERLNEAAELLVHGGDLAKIRMLGVLRLRNGSGGV